MTEFYEKTLGPVKFLEITMLDLHVIFRADVLDLASHEGMTKILRLFHLQESANPRFVRHPTSTFSFKNKGIAAFHRRKSRFMSASVASLFRASSSRRHVAS